MKRGKFGQMKLSFGMIFSIMLIIIFLVFGFYVISKFLDMKSSVEVGKFVDNLQNDITKMWGSSQGAQEETYTLPIKIESVCFVDFYSSSRGNEDIYKKLKQVYDNEQNFFFYPVGSGEGLDAVNLKCRDEINCLNIKEITKTQNPFCIESEKGKIKLTIKKNFNDAQVVITR